jgi:cephalosporin-C deacetylase-like acetyl esterase
MKTYRKHILSVFPLYLKGILITVLLAGLITRRGNAQEELNVIKNSWLEYTDASNSLYHYLSGRAYKLLNERSQKISVITTLEQWQDRQIFIKETLKDILGPFPEKTPLNAKIIRTIEKESFRVEHIVFESQPGFFVTSSLYIPSGLKKRIKAPAVIYCSGHSEDGYRSPVYQHVIQNLVIKGFIVFAFDPVGQGERLEYYSNTTGKSMVGGPTKEHSYPGAQAFIAGSSQALYMIWDGIRAVDYLLTRKEVDPSRIGITGRSGGGTQSAYIAAADNRIYAAAPENYITNYTRLFQSIGPQDAEQNLYNLISRGLDHPDFLMVRAPKPALLITTTRDMFSIQGARETYAEVSRIYKSYGKSDFFSMTEDDAPHESTVRNREAMYAFFQKFLNNPGTPLDIKTMLLSKEELQVTPTGQISTSFPGETVFSLNLRLAEKLEDKLNISRKNPELFFQGVSHSAETLSGYTVPDFQTEPIFTGRFLRDGYSIEKYFIRGEGDYIIPYLMFIPENAGKISMIYLHPEGKLTDALTGGEIEKFVKKGITVLVPDLIGTGEAGPGIFEGDANFNGASHNLWYASILINQSITGIQAGDVVRLARLLVKNNPETEISGFARKEMAPVMLHAAVFSPLIRSVILAEAYTSYRSIAASRFYNPHFIHSVVPGALKEYDLPDLAGLVAPRRLFIIGPVDATGNREDRDEIERDLEIVRAAFRYKSAEDKLEIITDSKSGSDFVEDLSFEEF